MLLIVDRGNTIAAVRLPREAGERGCPPHVKLAVELGMERNGVESGCMELRLRYQ